MKPYYEHGGITIYHGDCREILSSVEIGLVLTDPPYGIALENHGRNDGKRRDRDWTIANDHDTEVGAAVVSHCQREKFPLIVFAAPSRPWPGEWRSRLVWHKEGVGLGGDPDLCWLMDWELIQVANTGQLSGKRESAVLRFPTRPDQFWAHPAQKPIGLLRYLIRKSSAASPVVDPFMGSGSTLVAAKEEGRRAIGIEIEERYCEIAAKRLEQDVLPYVFAETEPDTTIQPILELVGAA